MKTVYISGKITGLSVLEYTQNFNIAESSVSGRYIKTISPIRINPLFGIKCWICYMLPCLYYQRKCTHSAFQKNWTESKGGVIEYFFAKFIFKQTIIFL